MKLRLTCKESVDLMVAGEDRALSRIERVALWGHLLICQACPRFRRQLDLMRAAMRAWRSLGPDA